MSMSLRNFLQTADARSALTLGRGSSTGADEPVSATDRIHVAWIGFGIIGKNEVRTVASIQAGFYMLIEAQETTDRAPSGLEWYARSSAARDSGFTRLV
jgi:hypothetical protein